MSEDVTYISALADAHTTELKDRKQSLIFYLFLVSIVPKWTDCETLYSINVF